MKLELTWSRLVDDAETTRDTADPLGFRAFASQLARDLVPGLTQSTDLARGFSLLALGLRWARDMFNDQALDPTEAFLRFERLWVGSQVKHHGVDTPFAGKRIAAALLKGADDTYPLTRSLTATQLYSGLWGTYRRSSVHFGLLLPGAQRRSGPRESELTPRGKQLADALKRSSFQERVRWRSFLAQEEVLLERLDGIQRDGHKPTKEETALLSTAFTEADRAFDRALLRLRESFDKKAELTLISLGDGRHLNETQQHALKAAQSLVALMEGIEAPYRAWVTSGEYDEIAEEIWHHPGWALIESWPAPDLIHLREEMKSVRGSQAALQRIHAHHQWLAAQRGSEPWDLGVEVAARRRFVPPDFCLSAASRLFTDGVLKGGSR